MQTGHRNRFSVSQKRWARPSSIRRPKEGYIDPSLFVRKATQTTQTEFVATHKFSDFAIGEKLLANVLAKGFAQPSPIQDQIIPVLLEGRDVIGIANTGTGKTAAFLVPLIEKIDKDDSQGVLIIAPTRELAVQIDEEFRSFAKGLGIFSAICIGGVGMGKQIMDIKRRPNFEIGTPGRLKDLENRRVLNFADYSNVVLDEVDRMLDMGFVKDIREIIGKLPRKRHSLFFSATMPENIRQLANEFLIDPVTVSVKTGTTAANVDQDIVKLYGKPKAEVLYQMLGQEGFRKVLVFGRTKWGIEKLAINLDKWGVRVASIHGNKNQNQRQRALEDFKAERVQVLLATDIAARGLDIANVSHVINLDIPATYDDYVHRIGRTGRADKKGIALTFVD